MRAARGAAVGADAVRVSALMRRAGRDAFLRDGGAEDIEAAVERTYRAMERCRRDELEDGLRRRLDVSRR